MNVIRDFDPGDERDDFAHHHVGPSDGLCARPFCDDAALPGEEFCRPCLVDVETALAELEERAA